MTARIINISVIVLLITGLAQTIAKEKVSGPQKIINKLESRLKNTMNNATQAGVTFPVELFEAHVRLKEAGDALKDKTDPKIMVYLLRACSLYVDVAETQVKLDMRREQTEKIAKKKDSILSELNNTYRQINQIERGYASNLRQALSEERKKALERQEEAQKKFSSLHSDLIKVKKDARGIILSMSDILFDIGKATLTGKLKTNLAKIAGILSVYREAFIVVEGHTDNIGTEDFNQALSERRASNVATFLLEQGISEDRLSAVGYGLTKPVSDNSTREGRQKNRRVDLVISEPKKVKE